MNQLPQTLGRPLAGLPAAGALAVSPEVFYRKLRRREALNYYPNFSFQLSLTVRYPRDYIFSNRFKETGEINLKLIIAWQHHSLTSSRSASWSWLLSGDSGSILFAAS